MLGRMLSRNDPRSFGSAHSQTDLAVNREVSVKESRLTMIARRGLALPAETLEQIRKTGIRCRPQLDVVYGAPVAPAMASCCAPGTDS